MPISTTTNKVIHQSVAILMDVLLLSINMVFWLKTQLLQFIAIAMHQVRILCIQEDYSILNVFFLEPKWCGRIFEHDDDDRERSGWATIYDGASLGQTHNLNDYGPIYVGNDRLSSIQAYGGNELLEIAWRSWSFMVHWKWEICWQFFKDVKLKSGRIPNHVAIISPALDTVTVTGAITTVWVLLVTTKHPQSNAHAQLNSSPLNMTFQEKIGLLTWTRTQRLSWTKWLWPILAIQLI